MKKGRFIAFPGQKFYLHIWRRADLFVVMFEDSVYTYAEEQIYLLWSSHTLYTEE